MKKKLKLAIFQLLCIFNLFANNPDLDKTKIEFNKLEQKQQEDITSKVFNDILKTGWNTENSKKLLKALIEIASDSEALNFIEHSLPVKFKRKKKNKPISKWFFLALKSLPSSLTKASNFLSFTAKNKQSLDQANSLTLKGNITSSFLISLCLNKEVKTARKLLNKVIENDLLFECIKERASTLKETEEYKKNPLLLVGLEITTSDLNKKNGTKLIDFLKPLKISSGAFCLMSLCSTLKYFWSCYKANDFKLDENFNELSALSIFQNQNFETLKESEFKDGNANNSLEAIFENCFFYNILPAAIISNFNISSTDKKNLFDKICQNNVFKFSLLNSYDFIKDFTAKSISDGLFEIYFKKFKQEDLKEKSKQEIKYDFFNKIRNNSLGLISACTPKDILDGLQAVTLSKNIDSNYSFQNIKKQSLSDFSTNLVFMLNHSEDDVFDSTFYKKKDSLAKHNSDQIIKNFLARRGLTNVLGFGLEKVINKGKHKISNAHVKAGKISLNIAKKLKLIKSSTATKIPLAASALIKSLAAGSDKKNLQISNQYFEIKKDNILQTKAYCLGDKLAFSHGTANSFSRIISQMIAKKIIQTILGSTTKDLSELNKNLKSGFFANLGTLLSVLKIPALTIGLSIQAKYEKLKSQNAELEKLKKEYEKIKDEKIKEKIETLVKQIAITPEEEEALSSFFSN